MEMIEDIRPLPFELSLWDRYGVYFCIACCVLFLGLLLVLWKRHKRKRPGSLDTILGKRGSHLSALEKLELLEVRLGKKEPIEAFAVELSFILRTYLQTDCQAFALEATTQELLHSLKTHSWKPPQALIKAIEHILTACDLSKFTNTAIPFDEQQSLYKQTKEAIKQLEALRLKV